eukprot:194518-Lingulodinium_polyedra.AAC.1
MLAALLEVVLDVAENTPHLGCYMNGQCMANAGPAHGPAHGPVHGPAHGPVHGPTHGQRMASAWPAHGH